MLCAMILRMLSLLAAFALLPAQAIAQDLDGHWAFKIDEATIFVFALEQGEDGTWQGTWTRPSQIDSNGVIFRNMSGSQTVRPSAVRQAGEIVQLTFAGPQGTNRNDVLRFTQVGENQAQLQYQGIPGDPFPLVRVQPDTPLGPFEDLRIYDRDNAVTEAEFALAEEPIEQSEPREALEPLADLGPMDEGELDALEMASADEASVVLEAEASEDDEEEESSRITADFLDGL